MIRRRTAVLLAVPVLVLAGAAIAQASIPDSGGVIHACYKTPVPAHGGNLQIIDSEAGGSCASGYVAVTWNHTGPQGPQGPQGLSGLAGYRIVTATTNIPNGYDQDFINGFAACPPDFPIPLGGGVNGPGPRSSGAGLTWAVDRSFPALPALGSGPGVWDVQLALIGTGPTTQATSFDVVVECVAEVRS